ncbi:MAG: T9SS type A sorting domain-containing protein [Ignavibacteriales bacterium]|nr:T9SS type A sorting domain-containing protein [Ignavibacteriales bacterium]
MREFPGQGLFIELPTIFDSTTNELIASTTTFGEIIFGKPDLQQGLVSPFLIEPIDQKKVLVDNPVILKWSGRGLLQSFNLQLAEDSLFNSTILDTTTINSFVQKWILPTNLQLGTLYRIRVESIADSSLYDTSDTEFTIMNPLDIKNISSLIPNQFYLSQNYPNPFNPSTKISWQSPIAGNQTLKIYDVLGNEVETLVNEYKPAGSYEVEFNASSLSSGIYFYKLQAGEFIQTRKMILLK